MLEQGTFLYWFYKKIFLASAGSVLWVFSNPIFYIGTVIVLLLERRFPAKPHQKTFSVGFTQDIVWVAVQAVLQVVVISFYTAFLVALYRQHLNFLTVQWVSDLPVFFKWTIWFLATDFMEWLHHWVRHKVPWFWHFHVIHHSQSELNMFTDLRYHAVEYIVSRTISIAPLLILQASIYDVVYFSIIHDWYTRLYHSNLKTHYGFLRYILVTPQSHRVHHSIESKHRDRNFGVIFAFWDTIFGTQYRGWSEYPDTGVREENFPLEKSVKGSALFWTPLKQHLYPFQAIARDLKRSKAE